MGFVSTCFVISKLLLWRIEGAARAGAMRRKHRNGCLVACFFCVNLLSVARVETLQDKRAVSTSSIVVATVTLSYAAGVVAAASAHYRAACSAQRIDVEAIIGGDGTLDSNVLCCE
eukprot:IDg1474t1